MGSFPHARRRQLAPLWRRGAAGAVDVALFVAYKSVALRVVGGEQAPRETATRLIALKEASQRGETVTPRAQREALRELVETLGGPTMPWTAWTLDMLVWGLIRAGTMAWTGGQSPGQVLFGVRVVGSGGRAVTTGRALVREAAEPTLLALSQRLLPRLMRFPARLLWSVLNSAWLILDPDRRSLGDLVADTRVVTAS